MANLLLPPQFQFVDADGVPYAGGKLYTYVPNTLSQKFTWQDTAQTIFNTNPIILDDRGACTVYGTGDYRLILTDDANNQVFDLLSSSPLLASAIGVIGPCLAAQSLQAFRDCAGITAAINAALANIALEPGPSGPTGPTGPAGPVGPVGPSGANASFSFQMTNPGYILLGPYGQAPLINFGFTASDTSGHASQNYALSFTQSSISVVGTVAAPDYWWVNFSATNNGGFTAVTTSPSVGTATGWYGGPIGFGWLAIGI